MWLLTAWQSVVILCIQTWKIKDKKRRRMKKKPILYNSRIWLIAYTRSCHIMWHLRKTIFLFSLRVVFFPFLLYLWVTGVGDEGQGKVLLLLFLLDFNFTHENHLYDIMLLQLLWNLHEIIKIHWICGCFQYSLRMCNIKTYDEQNTRKHKSQTK